MKTYKFSEKKSNSSIYLQKLEKLLNNKEDLDILTGFTSQKKMLHCGELLLKYLNETNTSGSVSLIEVINVQRSIIYSGPGKSLNIWETILKTVESYLPESSFVAKVDIGFAIHIWGEDIEDETLYCLNKIQRNLERFDLSIPLERKPRYLTLSTKIGYVIYPKDTGYLELYKPLSFYATLSTTGYINRDYPSTLKRFTQLLYTDVKNKIDIETTLFMSIENSDFDLEYQPQINLKTGRVFGAECLSRWSHNGLSKKNTQQYINIIENSRFVIDFTIASFKKLVYFLKKHEAFLTKDFHLSFNLSRAIYKWNDCNIAKMMEKELSDCKHLIKHIQIEITESAYLSKHLSKKAIQTMQELHTLGFSIAIDDFGSGYGSLKMITSNVPDIIKLDRSITQDLCTDNATNLFIKSLIYAAKYAKIDIIAEGVETEKEERILTELGLYYVQGFKYSKSLTEKDFLHFLKNSDYAIE